MKLDREGTFMARPVTWGVKTGKESQSVAVNMGFVVTAQRDGDEWIDWSQYDEHIVYGDFWIVKKDGSINTNAVDSLVRAFGPESIKWIGDIRRIDGDPPQVPVQIVVKAEDFKGTTYYKVAFINAADYEPQPYLADSTTVGGLQGRFGSLLRAAASSAAQGLPKADAEKKPAPKSPPKGDGKRSVEEARAALPPSDEAPMPEEADLPL